MDDFTKIPPHSVEAEQSLLGCFLLDPMISYKVREINSNDFYKEAHKIIFENIKFLVNENKPIDLITLVDKIKLSGHLEDIGGISYITSLSTIVPTTSNIDYYIKIVRDKALARMAIKQAHEIIDKLYNEKVEDVVLHIDSLKNEINGHRSLENNFVDISTIERNKNSRKAIYAGFNKLDSLIGGFRYGSLNILSGQPSSGKSTILNQIIANAIDQGHKAFIYSGELPGDILKEWFVRTVSNFEHLEEKTDYLGGKYYDFIDEAWKLVSMWSKDKLFIYGDDSAANDSNLLSTIEYLHLKKGIRLFVLDNLMTMQLGSNKDKYEKQKDVCISLKNIAKKYGLVIILVAHPSKAVIQKEEPTMYDVAGASEIVGSADLVLMTVRGTKEDPQSGIWILKNRNTGKQGIPVGFNFDDDRKRYYITEDERNKDYKYDKLVEFTQVTIANPFK